MQKITLGGRSFKPVTHSTLEHDIATCEMLQRMGMADLTARSGETDRQLQDRIMSGVVKSGELLPLLGHLIMPTAKNEWTPEMAIETAVFLGALKNPKDKATLLGLIVELALFFCKVALGCILTSQKSFPLAAETINMFLSAGRVNTETGVSSCDA